MSVPTLFDPDDSRDRRDEAIDRVERNAPPDFNEGAFAAVCQTARDMPTFIVDDVWRRLAPGIQPPAEARAMGAVMRRAVRSGVCAATQVHSSSTQPHCHAGPRRVWRSLLHKPEVCQ